MFNQPMIRGFTACFMFLLLGTSVQSTLEEDSQSLAQFGSQSDQKGKFATAPDIGRVKRSSERLQEDLDRAYPENREKKVPRGFLGIRGKKAPSSFLGMRGRRDDSSPHYPEYPDSAPRRVGNPLEGGAVQTMDLLKRAPSAFLGMRGKKAPSGFLGMRGKKAPSGFLGMRGKKAPSAFLGMRGKKTPTDYQDSLNDFGTYDDLEDVLQALRHRHNSQNLYEQDKRAPKGFLGMRGKKSGFESLNDEYYSPSQESLYQNTYNEVADDVMNEKRAPSAFLGMRG